ncbi:hypothetical protein FRB90_000680 [Tulasnella sp. 427]|nr:hypothetical protein FRB90_000680 [Tulasnella sp. 427]
MEKKDILILGATGFTGRLILKYLSTHPTRTQPDKAFTLGLAGRSVEKLRRAAVEVGMEDMPIHELDIQNEDQIRTLFDRYRVVVTSVGPFWQYGKPVAKVCAELGVHYVDITVPASGFDSVPSDLSAFYGVSALRRLYGSEVQARTSTSAFVIRGQNISGGTAATMLDIFSGGVPKWVRDRDPWLLSPVVGTVPSTKFIYRLPRTNILGFFYPMSPVNSAVVRRTWGLYQLGTQDSTTVAPDLPYGPKFEYEEFLECRSYIVAVLGNLVLAVFFGLMALSSTFRKIVERFFLYKPGKGPDERKFETGRVRLTNVTTSDEENPRVVKTIIRGKGEPGYFLTSGLICTFSTSGDRY